MYDANNTPTQDTDTAPEGDNAAPKGDKIDLSMVDQNNYINNPAHWGNEVDEDPKPTGGAAGGAGAKPAAAEDDTPKPTGGAGGAGAEPAVAENGVHSDSVAAEDTPRFVCSSTGCMSTHKGTAPKSTHLCQRCWSRLTPTQRSANKKQVQMQMKANVEARIAELEARIAELETKAETAAETGGAAGGAGCANDATAIALLKANARIAELVANARITELEAQLKEKITDSERLKAELEAAKSWFFCKCCTGEVIHPRGTCPNYRR